MSFISNPSCYLMLKLSVLKTYKHMACMEIRVSRALTDSVRDSKQCQKNHQMESQIMHYV